VTARKRLYPATYHRMCLSAPSDGVVGFARVRLWRGTQLRKWLERADRALPPLMFVNPDGSRTNLEVFMVFAPPVSDNHGRTKVASPRHDEPSREGTIGNRFESGFGMLGADADEHRISERGLSVDAAVLRSNLALGGWHVEKAGTTGRRRGRPAAPGFTIIGEAVVLERMREIVEKASHGYALDELFAAAVPGRSRVPDPGARRELAKTVAALRTSSSGANARTLARVIGCTPNTVYRLARKGRLDVPNNSPKGGEPIYWGFRDWTRTVDRVTGDVFFSPPRQRVAETSFKELANEGRRE
jgi:hypothetical protein